MGTVAGVGESTSRDNREAGGAAAQAALEPLGGRPADLVVVFATAGFDQRELMAGVQAVTGATPLVGCSGAGVITQRGSDEGSHAVAVMAVASDRIRFRTLRAETVSADPGRCAQALAAAINDSDSPRLVWLFPDGLRANCTALLRALQSRVQAPVSIFGGAAGEMHQFQTTFQYHDTSVLEDGVTAVVVGGDFEFDIEVTHGCHPLGLEHEITRSDGSLVHELDGRPAWNVLKEYLDGAGDGLTSGDVPYLCVAQTLPEEARRGYADYIIRVPLRLEEGGALFFPGDLPEGERVLMARREVDDVVEHAIESARRMKSRHEGRTPAFVLQSDCAGRGRLLLGNEVTSRLIDPVQAVLGKSTPWIGFHSYGEIAPLGQTAYYHNYTMALCAVYDAES